MRRPLRNARQLVLVGAFTVLALAACELILNWALFTEALLRRLMYG